ncbi:SoxY-related AACIE arm protein [Roseiarcaceae bacterium H3SJ34-1]|uniref:SoxY-related AACIE arm protein n=1 Tax=Terripilifer ovatus TaxID=3032367 RepID=UPI003AB94257|nr:SoxY-related AACIE arm protein [Roseiarcaceae bacterium H3SJ34-1]
MKRVAETMLEPTRRIFILRTGQLGLGLVLGAAGAQRARATPDMMRQLVDEITGGKPMTKGKVTLDLPPLVDNGNTVPMTVSVDSPMTDDNYVRVIHVVNEKNPQPDVITCTMGPRCGRASFATRIKLADSQKITAVAEMNDGSFWFDNADVIVTLAACLEDIL